MGFYPAKFGLPRPFCYPVISRHATDGRTDRRTDRQPRAIYNAPSPTGAERGHNNRTDSCNGCGLVSLVDVLWYDSRRLSRNTLLHEFAVAAADKFKYICNGHLVCSWLKVQDNSTKTHHQSVSAAVVVSGDERTSTTNVTVSLTSVVVSMPPRLLLFLTRYTTTQHTRQASAFGLLVCSIQSASPCMLFNATV